MNLYESGKITPEQFLRMEDKEILDIFIQDTPHMTETLERDFTDDAVTRIAMDYDRIYVNQSQN